MSSATQPEFVKDAWQNSRNARTLRAFMALQNQEIGARIAALRKAKGNPPQTIVAAALNVGERTYQTWEQGEAKPGYRNLERLAEYYGVTENYILTGEPESSRTPDLLGALDDGQAARLDRIEHKLNAIVTALYANNFEIATPETLAAEAEALGQAAAEARASIAQPKSASG